MYTMLNNNQWLVNNEDHPLTSNQESYFFKKTQRRLLADSFWLWQINILSLPWYIILPINEQDRWGINHGWHTTF